MKIAYLGPKGTFSEEVAFRFFPKEAEFIARTSIYDVLESVKNNEVDKCIVPIENTLAGTINMSIDGLLMFDLMIEADIIFPISLHLIGQTGREPSEIKEVKSISPALDQCRDYIRQRQLKTNYVDSTAQAAHLVKEQDKGTMAAIASEWVAKLYGLHILERNIQDNEMNHTKFIIVSKKRTITTSEQKTMLLITPNDEYAGVLSSILNIFSSLSINLTWIESRPTRKKLGTYHFFIEAEMSLLDLRAEKAITILKTYGHDIEIMGSYSTTTL